MSGIESGFLDEPEPEYTPKGIKIYRETRVEPPPANLTLPKQSFTIGGIEVTPPVQPAGIRYSLVTAIPNVSAIPDELTQELAIQYYTTQSVESYTVIPPDGDEIVDVKEENFLLDERTVEETYAKEAGKVNRLALASGLEPRIFEIAKLPFNVHEVKLSDIRHTAQQLSRIDWKTPGYAVETAQQALDRFSAISGLNSAGESLKQEIEKGLNHPHIGIWAGNFPCPEMYELPLIRVVQYLDEARSKEKGDAVRANDFRNRSLALKSRLHKIVEGKFDPRLTEALTGARTLQEMYGEIPSEIRAALYSSQVKNVALSRIDAALALVGKAVFLEKADSPIVLDGDIATDYIRKKLRADITLPNFRDVGALLDLVKLGVIGYPLPEPFIAKDPRYVDSFLAFQEAITYEAVKILENIKAA